MENTTYKHIMIIDVTSLPQEYNDKETVKECIEAYTKDFGLENFKIIPVDNSRQNTQGNYSSGVQVIY